MSDDKTWEIKVPIDLPAPPTLTPADIARAEEESRELSAAYAARTAGFEVLTPDDLKVRAR